MTKSDPLRPRGSAARGNPKTEVRTWRSWGWLVVMDALGAVVEQM